MTMKWQQLGFLLLIFSVVFAMVGKNACGATIHTTLSPSGPMNIGDEFLVELSLSSWDASSDGEVDGLTFNVDFDPALFEYVAGSGSALDDGSEFLAQANQQADYTLFDESDGSLPGRWVYSAYDDGFDFDLGGSAAAGGPLGSFRLMAISAGTGQILPTAPGATLFGTVLAGDPDFIFDATDGFSTISPAAGVSLLGASMTIVPEPSVSVMVMIGCLVVFCRIRGFKK